MDLSDNDLRIIAAATHSELCLLEWSSARGSAAAPSQQAAVMELRARVLAEQSRRKQAAAAQAKAGKKRP